MNRKNENPPFTNASVVISYKMHYNMIRKG